MCVHCCVYHFSFGTKSISYQFQVTEIGLFVFLFLAGFSLPRTNSVQMNEFAFSLLFFLSSAADSLLLIWILRRASAASDTRMVLKIIIVIAGLLSNRVPLFVFLPIFFSFFFFFLFPYFHPTSPKRRVTHNQFARNEIVGLVAPRKKKVFFSFGFGRERGTRNEASSTKTRTDTLTIMRGAKRAKGETMTVPCRSR